MIVQADGPVVFSAPTEDEQAADRTLEGLGVEWTRDRELGKVSVVGAGMKSHPGVAATTFATLEEEGIEPVIVTTSPIVISCLVRRDDVERAVRALHEALGLSADGAEHESG
jgi:aspartate kinase